MVILPFSSQPAQRMEGSSDRSVFQNLWICATYHFAPSQTEDYTKHLFLYNCLWKRLFIHISFHWKIFSIGNLASLPLSAIEGSSLKKQIIYFAPQMFMSLLFCARICQDKLSGQNCFVAVISYQAAGEAWAETGYNWFNGWAIELTQRKYLAGSV